MSLKLIFHIFYAVAVE